MKRIQEQDRSILEGSLPRVLLRLAWPVMLGNTIQVIYNLTDTFWLGRLSAEAVAAISISFPIIFFLIAIGGGMTMAGTTLVAQYTGAGDVKGASRISGQLLVVMTGLAILMSISGILFSERLLLFLGSPPEIIQDARDYLNIIFGGILFMFFFFVFSSLLTGWGDTKTPMKLKIFTALLNILIDPFLIFGWWVFPPLGVAGAAYATVFSRSIAGFYGLYILFKKKSGLSLTPQDLVPDWTLIKKIFIIGFPAAGEMSIRSLGMMAMMAMVARFGAMAVAAYGIASRILSLVILPSMGLSMATSTVVGQNIGSDQMERAEQSTWISAAITFGLMSTCGLIAILLAPSIVGIFTHQGEVIAMGTDFLKIVGFSFGFMGIEMVIGGSFRGAGKTLIAMIISLIVLWGLTIPLAQIFGLTFGWGTQGIWRGIFLAHLVGAVMAILWFKQGTWKEKVIE